MLGLLDIKWEEKEDGHHYQVEYEHQVPAPRFVFMIFNELYIRGLTNRLTLKH